MKCCLCKKQRKTAPHYGIIRTPNGQEIQEYEFGSLCMECSIRSYHWNLNSLYIRIGKQFLIPTKTI